MLDGGAINDVIGDVITRLMSVGFTSQLTTSSGMLQIVPAHRYNSTSAALRVIKCALLVGANPQNACGYGFDVGGRSGVRHRRGTGLGKLKRAIEVCAVRECVGRTDHAADGGREELSH